MWDCNGECDTTGERDSRLCYDRYNEGWGKKCTHSLWADIDQWESESISGRNIWT